MVAGFTTFQPTVNTNPSPPSTAGKFNLVYVVGASSLEDQYTEGLSGDVIRRVGDTVTLLGSTLFLNTANTYTYEVAPTQLLLGARHDRDGRRQLDSYRAQFRLGRGWPAHIGARRL